MGIQNEIISYVRDGILEGRFKPGERLKGRDYFCKKFHTTPITVQRAFNRLIERGFVTAERSVGTFVSQKPTCLRRVAFMYPGIPNDVEWTSFSQLILDSISEIEQSLGIIIKNYFGMGKNSDSVDVFNEFQEDLKNGTLVGAVYLAELRYFRSIAWKNVQLPYYDVAQPGQALGRPRIELVKKEYFAQGVEAFKRLNRERIAIITVDLFSSEHEQMVKDLFADKGLSYYSYLVQSFSVIGARKQENGAWIARFVKLLFSLPESKKPDGIFVTDDNFVDATYQALLDIGIIPGKDIDVIAHANFPIKQWNYPGMYRLGYHIPNVISQVCRNLINGITDTIEVQPKIQECHALKY